MAHLQGSKLTKQGEGTCLEQLTTEHLKNVHPESKKYGAYRL